MPAVRKGGNEYEERRRRRWQEMSKVTVKGRGTEINSQRIDETTVKALPAQSGKVGRNEPCPCGSGKKFKKCCLQKEDA
jgi:hypothetical protein